MRSILSTQTLSSDEIFKIFERARQLRDQPRDLSSRAFVGAMAFLEPSTRTALSFQMACHRLNLRLSVLPALNSSVKGESLTDTFLTVAAMKPDFLIWRSGSFSELESLTESAAFPVLNGGTGAEAHPTQALLDLFTLVDQGMDPSQLKLFFIGDLKNSRVVRSCRELVEKLGGAVGYLASSQLAPEGPEWVNARQFQSAQEGIEWANVLYGLRTQRERMGQAIGSNEQASVKFGAEEAKLNEDVKGAGPLGGFQLSSEDLKSFSPSGQILHPGPVGWGDEYSESLRGDSRVRILDQVACGVPIRMACLEFVLGI